MFRSAMTRFAARSYATKKFTALAQTNGIQCVTHAGGYEILTDEPAMMGGLGEGPTPMDVNLASLVGCENVTARFFAAKKGIDIGRMKFEVNGHFNPRCFVTGKGQGYWEKVVIDCLVETDASQEELDELKEMTSHRCPVASLFHATDIEMETNWKIAEEADFDVEEVGKKGLFQRFLGWMVKKTIRD